MEDSMRPSRYSVRTFALAFGILLAAPGTSLAQAPRVAPAAAMPLSPRPSDGNLRIPRVDLFELSRYAGWGGTIGAGVGLAYGLVFERGPDKALGVVADTVMGFSVGLVAGTAVYITKLVLGR
jgi:hypothetical protein